MSEDTTTTTNFPCPDCTNPNKCWVDGCQVKQIIKEDVAAIRGEDE